MPAALSFRFSPAKTGLDKVLGPLEAEIMPLVWTAGCSTVKQVHRKLLKQRYIAYTTVMTTMSRLAEKGVLTRERTGLAYIYTPAITREDFIAMTVQQVLDGLLEDHRDLVVAYMARMLK
jgi:predicted transcriptional regulator